MAIEKLNSAAKEAQPRVINMSQTQSVVPHYLGCRISEQPITMASSSPTAVRERQEQRQSYPNFKVVVLDDDVNTFQHVVECLVRYIPGVQPDQAWELAHRIDSTGSAVVWCGPQEQAELYHQQLGAEGLTMAPLERA